jgi:signal transduction histidine kinase
LESLSLIADPTQLKGPFVGKDIEHLGVRYRTVWHPLHTSEHEMAFLSILKPASELDALKNRIIFSLGVVALMGIFAMSAIGYAIARTITAPIEQLVQMTVSVAKGDLQYRAHVSSRDEIGALAESFNRMIEKLLQYKQRLVESEKMATAGQMAAGFAHEVRNPLTSIKMLGQLLHNRLKGQFENQRMLISLVQEIDRLDNIIQEMIDRTRPGELRLETSDLNRLVEEVTALAADHLASQKVFVEHRLSPQLPEVEMDREKIKQVLWNLIVNAREAMPKGGVLTISTQTGRRVTVELTIEDSGMGIADENSDHIFQPFFTTKPEGLGLGLTISRKIIDKHGGGLTLENRNEGGARAKVTLPLKCASQNESKE